VIVSRTIWNISVAVIEKIISLFFRDEICVFSFKAKEINVIHVIHRIVFTFY
jgi:hypothetical protein